MDYFEKNNLKRFAIIMKLIVILTFGLFISVSANTSGQGKLKFSSKSLSLSQFIKEIEKQTNYFILFNNQELNLNSKISTNKKKSDNIKEELNEILGEVNLACKLLENYIIIYKKRVKAVELLQQIKIKTITGKVVDCDNIPLPGVSIIIKGTTRGVSTDIEGKFTIKTEDKPNIVLIASFVGMENQEIKIGKKNHYNIRMCNDTESLDEVVITGYTQRKKANSTSASAKISSKVIQRQTSSTLEGRLEGMATGLNIQTVSPQNGKVKQELILRGISTFDEPLSQYSITGEDKNSLNRQPLIVVDNFPYEGKLSDLDPNIIKSMDVLKDAAATALWGLRASNGVIVITTNRGRAGHMNINFNSLTTISSKLDLEGLKIANSKDLIDVRSNNLKMNPTNVLTKISDKAYNYNTFREIDNFQQIWASFYDKDDSQYYNNTTLRDQRLNNLAKNNVMNEYEDNFLRRAYSFQNSLNISGGNDKILYSFSASHLDSKEHTIGDNSQRFNTALSTDFIISKKLKLRVDFSYSRTDEQLNGIDPSNLYTSQKYKINIFDKLKDDNGNLNGLRQVYLPYKQEYLDKGFYRDSYNPIAEQKLIDNDRITENYRMAAGLSYQIYKGISLEVKYQVHKNSDENNLFRDENAWSMLKSFDYAFKEIPAGETKVKETYLKKGSFLEREFKQTTNTTFRTNLNYNKILFDDHQVNALVGLETTENVYSINRQRFLNYNNKTGSYNKYYDYLTLLNYGYDGAPTELSSFSLSNMDVFINDIKNRTMSNFYNLGYSYKERYNIEGSLKFSRSTAVGLKQKLSDNLYYAFSGSWNIHKENFFSSEWLDILKLRASYGENGNIRKGTTTYTTISYANSSKFTLNDYADIKSIGNPYLEPEKTKTTNLGLDFAFLGKIRGNLDLYSKQSSNLYVQTNLNPTYGISTQFANHGEISNKGIELNLQSLILQRKDFDWRINLNISYNANKVLKYGKSSDDTFNTISLEIMRGKYKLLDEDVSSKMLYKYAGLDENGDPMVYDRNNKKYRYDAPEIQEFTLDDVKITKPFTAPGFGGLTNVLRYKNFTLSSLISFKFGHVFKESTEYMYAYDQRDDKFAYHTDISKRWKQKGDEKKTGIPAMPTKAEQLNYNRTKVFIDSDYGLHDASFIRLKDITLDYTFNKKSLKKFGIKYLNLKFQVKDLGLIWTANSKNIDPESVPFSGWAMGYGGMFTQAYRPGMKATISYVLGLNVKF